MAERLGTKLWVDSMSAICYSVRAYRLDYTWTIAPRRLTHNVLWYVLEGSFTFSVNGEPLRAARNDLVLLPADAVVESRAIGDAIELVSVNFDAAQTFFPTRRWSDLLPIPVRQPASPGVRDLVRDMAAQSSSSVTSGLALQGRLLLLLAALIEETQVGGFAGEAVPSGDARIAGLTEYLFLREDRIPSVSELCELARLSESQLRKRFRAATGLSPQQYIHQVKIEQAKDALARRNERISELARRLGFEDANYFSRLFKKLAGCSPREYREKVRGV